jgi:hypothetical protein
MFSRLTGQWLTGLPAVRDGHALPPSAPTMSASVDNTISYPPFASLADADSARKGSGNVVHVQVQPSKGDIGVTTAARLSPG